VVEIKVPSPVEIEVAADDFILFCLRFYEDIYWARTQNGKRIAEELLKEVERCGEKYDQNNKDAMEAALFDAYSRGAITSQKFIYRLINPHNKRFVNLSMFKVVGTIEAGGSFGERSLLRNEDRAATIVCKTPSTFATLSRKAYTWVFDMAQRKEMKEQVFFFKQFRVFSQLSNRTVERITYFMKE
jgi:hypothetical protein